MKEDSLISSNNETVIRKTWNRFRIHDYTRKTKLHWCDAMWYNAQCILNTVYCVQCTLYTVHCTLYNVSEEKRVMRSENEKQKKISLVRTQ